MSAEFKPGATAIVLRKVDAEAWSRADRALTALALVVERQAKINASSGSHKYGTPTPARPGTGPAIISGTLRRALTHTDIKLISAGTKEIRVGTARGFYPSYGGKSRTPANLYGKYLEKTGLRNGAKYPFLGPALKFATKTALVTGYSKILGAEWKKYT